MRAAAVRSRAGAIARRARALAPTPLAVAAGFLASGLIAAAAGVSPFAALGALLTGAFDGPQVAETVNRAAPLIGMTLAAALPFRGGMINLGGDGQLVLGGLAATLIALDLPAPASVRTGAAICGGMLVGGGYGALAALIEIASGIPLLVASWLLAYPARGVCGWLVHGPLHDPADALSATHRIPRGVRLTHLVAGTPVTTGVLMVAAAALLIVFVDRRTALGFELRMRGSNQHFAAYAGIALVPQSVGVMAASGALAGLVGAILVLGSQYRFTDGALLAPLYTWSGTLAALLAGGEPVGAILAGAFFAALQTGGFSMERTVGIPRVLTMVLEAVIILFLSMGGRLRAKSA